MRGVHCNKAILFFILEPPSRCGGSTATFLTHQRAAPLFSGNGRRGARRTRGPRRAAAPKARQARGRPNAATAPRRTRPDAPCLSPAAAPSAMRPRHPRRCQLGCRRHRHPPSTHPVPPASIRWPTLTVPETRTLAAARGGSRPFRVRISPTRTARAPPTPMPKTRESQRGTHAGDHCTGKKPADWPAGRPLLYPPVPDGHQPAPHSTPACPPARLPHLPAKKAGRWPSPYRA